MPSFSEITKANSARPKTPLKAVFVGATSGIGLGAVEATLKNSRSSTLFIIGRSKSTFASTLAALQKIDSTATVIFIEAQVSLLNDVERVCDTIKSQTTSLDVLWLSQGGLSSKGHYLSPEGLFVDYAVAYYSRMLFMHRLIPLLSHAKTGGRVVSILSAGQEGPIVNPSDPGLQNAESYTFWGALKQGVTLTSLSMVELAKRNKSVSFVHTNPGMVSTPVHTKWADTMTGWMAPLGYILKWIMIPLFHSLGWTPAQAGEIGFFEATSERFDSQGGKNFFRLGEKGDEVGEEGRALLKGYEDDGTQRKVWEHTLGVFDMVLGQ